MRSPPLAAALQAVSVLFSEPKIPQSGRRMGKYSSTSTFQCSSASRKFLNRRRSRWTSGRAGCFSALQRAENSSIISPSDQRTACQFVSVLFSEPKIPQYNMNFLRLPCHGTFQCSSASRKFLNAPGAGRPDTGIGVSVLFSEPKIPQLRLLTCSLTSGMEFQCSSASRKFLNPDPRTCVHPYFRPR